MSLIITLELRRWPIFNYICIFLNALFFCLNSKIFFIVSLESETP